jgi:chemotaxis signal transduction protein
MRQRETLEQDQASDEVKALLRRRAKRLSTPDTVEKIETLPVAEFMIGKERYALPLRSLRAVLPLTLVAPIPLAPPWVVGLYRFEGRLLSVFSFSSLLGVSGWEVDPRVLLIIEVKAGRFIAVDCEQIPTPSELSFSSIERGEANRSKASLIPVLEAAGQQVQLIEDIEQLIGSVSHAG